MPQKNPSLLPQKSMAKQIWSSTGTELHSSLLLLYMCYLHEALLLLFRGVTKLLFQSYSSESTMKWRASNDGDVKLFNWRNQKSSKLSKCRLPARPAKLEDFRPVQGSSFNLPMLWKLLPLFPVIILSLLSNLLKTLFNTAMTCKFSTQKTAAE